MIRALVDTNVLAGLREIVRVCAPGEEEVDRALESSWQDFEDALVYQAAMSLRARCIVTRNAHDFDCSSLPVLDCAGFFEWVERKNYLAYSKVTL